MSRKDKLIKSKSIYTVRSKHTTTVNGTIYENDNVTIIPNDGIFNEDMPLFSESNFKFRIGTGGNGRKKHSRGGWISVDGSNNNVWTLNNLPIQHKTDEGRVVIKPNYSSLKDFAYYGSAVELIKATINDLIMRYPGGISYYQTPPEVFIGNNKYYLISNEFNIDFWTPGNISPDELENPMRVLGASYMNYEGVNYVNDEESSTYDINLNICITGDCLNTIIGAISFKDSNTTNEITLSKSRDFILGVGEEGEEDGGDEEPGESEDNEKPEENGGNEEPGESEDDEKPEENEEENGDNEENNGESGKDESQRPWSVMKIFAYSGTSSYYLPNTLISDVEITMLVTDVSGATDTFRGVTDSKGILSFSRTQLTVNLNDCLRSFSVTGTVNGNIFVNTLDYNCSKEEQPIVNLYINYNETPINKFPYIAFVKDSSSYNALENIGVVFYGRLTFKDGSNFTEGVYYTDKIFTDNTGRAFLDAKQDEWYSAENEEPTPISGMAGLFYIASWYCKAYYDEEHPITNVEGEQYYTTTTANIYIDTSSTAIPFTKLEILGKVGLNGNVGSNCLTHITIFDKNRIESTVTGYTNNDGAFYAVYEDFVLPKSFTVPPVSFTCMMEYKDEIVEGNRVYFSMGSNPESYSQTLYFKEQNVGEEIKLYATAYTVFHGIRTPLPNTQITFRATNDKLIAVNGYYTIVKTTNENGVVIASTEEEWECHNTETSNLPFITKWSISTIVNGTTYSGEGNTNLITNGDISDIILVEEVENWDELNINVKSVSDNPIFNARVRVCATTENNHSWMYYSLKSTDDNGNAKFKQESRWTHINGTATATTNQFSYWKCEAIVGDEVQTSEKLEILNNNYNFIFDEEKPINPAIGYNCGILSGSSEDIFYIYLDGDGKKYLLANQENYHNGQIIIRPKSGYTEEFWNNLDDFEKVLLDRTTKPIYKAKLETPYIENYKHYYKYENYVWPTVDGVNPDLTSNVFQTYLNSLLDIAEYYDEYEADNLWRMMTHEAIKNLDWSFMRHSGEDAVDMDDIDSSRMKAMLRIQSRVYDDIKRYADAIKSVNSITYDEKNNIPDYFLSDVLELNGFEAKNVSNFSGLTSDVIYTATTSVGRADGEVNSDFMRRLALNAKYLMSMKGTRRGIEGVLGMFGYISGTDYTISEYVGVAHNFPNYKETSALRILGENEYVNYDDNTNMMIGYPVAVISPALEEPTEDDYYLVPWMNKNIGYYNNIYFQEKGGWGRKHSKSINLSITTANEINDYDFDFKIYDETIPYIRYVDTISDMTSLSNALIYQNMVCYVNDISELFEKNTKNTSRVTLQTSDTSDNGGRRNNIGWSTDTGVTTQNLEYSHYFVLKNTALSSYVGFVDNDLYHCYGWRNVPVQEYKNGAITEDGLRVLYLESLIMNNKGNNPHCGFANYDDGNSYIHKYNTLFGTAIEEGKFEYLKDGDEIDQENYDKILSLGFDILNYCEDNKKCHYFEKDGSEIIYGNDEVLRNGIDKHIEYELHYIDTENGSHNDVAIDCGAEYCGKTIDNEDYYFYNPEKNGNYNERTKEAASNSVVNIKNLLITFYIHNNEYFKKYIEDVVLKYLIEMIPSTTILKYEFINETSGSEKYAIASDDIEINGDTIRINGDGVTSDADFILVEDNTGLINNGK